MSNNTRTTAPPRVRPARTLGGLLAALLLAVFGAAFALDSSEDMTVLQALQESPDQFSTFLSLVEQAGLTESLSGSGPVTVLAPTNAAFDQMSQGVRDSLQMEPQQAASVVNGLILSGNFMMVDLQDAAEGSLAPMSGEVYDVQMTAGGLTINGVGFDAGDVDNVYSNGVVHVTNDVVLPPALRAVDQAERDAAVGDADPLGTADPATTPMTPVVPPTAPEEPEATTAFVRVLQLSPATNVDVVLVPEEEGLTTLDLSGLAYATSSGYQELQPGSYLVNATLPESQDALFDPPSQSFQAGNYYTVTITGLQTPSDDATDDDEGFGGWLRNLFGGDGDRDALAMMVTTYQDEVRRDATDTRLRVIDAAPGSPAFDVVAVDASGERNVIANDLTYGDDSGAHTLDESVTGLEITAADSEALALDLTGHLPLAGDSTIFIIGTSFEGAPFDVLVLPNGAADANGATDGTDGTESTDAQ